MFSGNIGLRFFTVKVVASINGRLLIMVENCGGNPVIDTMVERLVLRQELLLLWLDLYVTADIVGGQLPVG